ncbi:IS3 family transposase [Roseibium sp. RKSG952]|uniref:IS3 family transposase n=1 Tax=Roseibium sp. RKSG952 TaxID=2529384 RepID=UPI0012BBE219|nr:IS3 family transposase [Roseibium sp. RKSG952]MTI00406.1 hypothetical protein [Roseibium sp. RKSG952]
MAQLRRDNKRLKEENEVMRDASAFSQNGSENVIAKLAFIAAHVGNHSTRLYCRVLGVSRSRFHSWQRTPAERGARAARRDALIDEIKSIFNESEQRCGASRIHSKLCGLGYRGARRLVAKLMTEKDIRPPIRKRGNADDHG